MLNGTSNRRGRTSVKTWVLHMTHLNTNAYCTMFTNVKPVMHTGIYSTFSVQNETKNEHYNMFYGIL